MLRNRSRPGLITRTSGAVAAFSPLDIANLAAWYDAADTATITQSGGNVSQWNDKSGNAYHLTQGTGSKQPITGTRNINGLNVLDFDGSADDIRNSAFLSTLGQGDMTTFTVFASDVTGSERMIWSFNGGDDLCLLMRTGDFMYRHAAAGATPFRGEAVQGPLNTNTNAVATVRSGSNYRIRLNGGSGVGQAGGVSNIGTPNITIGSQNSFRFFDGRVAEKISYSRALTLAEINQIGNYLAAKWGITWTTAT